MSEFCLVLCTFPSISDAEQAAHQLVNKKYAACVNILPQVRSVYRWQGQVQQDQEVQLLIKTRQELIEQAQSLIESVHPYDVPEWLVIDITKGSDAYENWMRNSLL